MSGLPFLHRARKAQNRTIEDKPETGSMTCTKTYILSPAARLTRAALILSLGAMVAFTNASSADAAPSFGCKKTYSATERAICQSTHLSKLDRWMSSEYFALRRQLKGRERRILKNDQRKWLKVRNRCHSSRSCLSDQYYFRIAELVEWDL